MKKYFIALFMAILVLPFVNAEILIDNVNIGDIVSETDHGHGFDVGDWSNIWTWGGNYGGGDDGTFRLLMGQGDGCTDNDKDAYFSMFSGLRGANKLTLRHLDGSQDDSFEVYVKDGDNWNLIGKYTAGISPEETWTTTSYNFDLKKGRIDFKSHTINPSNQWCETWGQVAFSLAEISNTNCYNYNLFGKSFVACRQLFSELI